MDKRAIIDSLISMFVTGNTSDSEYANGYNTGLIEALKLVQKLDEPAKTTFTQAQKIEQILKKKLSDFTMLNTIQLDELIMHFGNEAWLNAMKTYKEATGIGLKEAKNEIDAARDEFLSPANNS